MVSPLTPNPTRKTEVLVRVPTTSDSIFVVYYDSRKREVKRRRKNEDRCDERLNTKGEESTCLVCTGFHEELEHLKIKTRLISAKFANVMGEYAS